MTHFDINNSATEFGYLRNYYGKGEFLYMVILGDFEKNMPNIDFVSLLKS